MRDPFVPHGVAQCKRDVALSADLFEPLRSESTVERLELGVTRFLSEVGHGDRAYDVDGSLRRGFRLADGRSGQVACGTQTVPLRAAAFRP